MSDNSIKKTKILPMLLVAIMGVNFAACQNAGAFATDSERGTESGYAIDVRL